MATNQQTEVSTVGELLMWKLGIASNPHDRNADLLNCPLKTPVGEACERTITAAAAFINSLEGELAIEDKCIIFSMVTHACEVFYYG